MPDIPVGNQVFDLVFHSERDIVFAGLLTGEIKAFSYKDDGSYDELFGLRPTKRSCRGLASNLDGLRLFSVTKDKTLHIIDTELGKVLETKTDAHDNPINRVASLMPHMISTGDDEGVVKLWDTRTLTEMRSYTHHADFISDFLWLDDKKHLIVTSGDGTLSALDVRANKTVPFAQSEDQEDELLSVVAIKDSAKLVVGTQIGVLSVFDRKKGYGDCVDRILGHPSSIDALTTINSDVIATGSSDGLIRMVQILPTKFLGVVADHGDFPVERLKVDRNGKWLGSASHDEVLKLTDISDAFEESEAGSPKEDLEERSDEEVGEEREEQVEEDSDVPPVAQKTTRDAPSDDSDLEESKKKKRRKNKKKKSGSAPADSAFFSGL